MTEEKPSPENKKENKKDNKKECQPPASLNEVAKAELKKNSEEKEFGGFEDSGLKEPTRFGDWEVKGRCSDF